VLVRGSVLKLTLGDFKVESSKSRSGKHVSISTLLVYKKKEGLLPYTKCLVSEAPTSPLYRRGSAKLVKIEVDHGDLVVYVHLVKNFKGAVKGYLNVYSSKGELLYRAKYCDGVVRFSKGSPVYAWLVRVVLDATKTPVKATYLGDEK
jgi:hypothetical protein